MNRMLIAGLAAATMTSAAFAADLTHRVTHDHQGRAVTTHYEGVIDIALRQRGMAGAPGRMGAQICDWNATVNVSRTTQGAATLPLSARPVMSGMRAGDCLTVASGIERDVARRHDELRDHVVTVAEADRPTLTAGMGATTGTD
jgi:hypothetical protein